MWIRVEFGPGMIVDAVEEMQELAQRIQCNVITDINGVEVTVFYIKNATEEILTTMRRETLRRYSKDFEAKHKKPA